MLMIPLATGIQMVGNAQFATGGALNVYTALSEYAPCGVITPIPASGNYPSGSTSIVVPLTNSAGLYGPSGNAVIPGDAVSDTSNPSALPAGCAVKTVAATMTQTTVTLNCAVAPPGVATNDAIVFTGPAVSSSLGPAVPSNWTWIPAWNGPFPTGDTAIQLDPYQLSTYNLVVGMEVADLTNSTANTSGCTVGSVGTTGVVSLVVPQTTTVCALTGPVATGDIISFSPAPPTPATTTPITPAANFVTPPTFYSVTSPNFAVIDNFSDCYVAVSPSAVVTILPPPLPRTGLTCTIKDVSGQAGTYNITWSGASDGTSPAVIGVNHGWVTVRYDGYRWDIIGSGS